MSDKKEEKKVVAEEGAVKEVVKIDEKAEVPVKNTKKDKEIDSKVSKDSYEYAATKGFSFWAKFFAILLFINSGILLFFGLLTIWLLGLGIIFWIPAGIMIFMGVKIWTASIKSDSLTDKKGEDFKNSAFEIIGALRTTLKTYGIVVLVWLGFMLVSFLILLISLVTNTGTRIDTKFDNGRFDYSNESYKLK